MSPEEAVAEAERLARSHVACGCECVSPVLRRLVALVRYERARAEYEQAFASELEAATERIDNGPHARVRRDAHDSVKQAEAALRALGVEP